MSDQDTVTIQSIVTLHRNGRTSRQQFVDKLKVYLVPSKIDLVLNNCPTDCLVELQKFYTTNACSLDLDVQEKLGLRRLSKEPEQKMVEEDEIESTRITSHMMEEGKKRGRPRKNQ